MVAITTFFLVTAGSIRQVVDGDTKQPLANVYVTFAFSGDFFMGVESRRRCYRLDVEKTDTEGRFPFPNGRHSLDPFLSDAEVVVTLYKPGYRTLEQPSAAEEYSFENRTLIAKEPSFEMVVDPRPWRSNPPFGIEPVAMGVVASNHMPDAQKTSTAIPPRVLGALPQERVDGRDADLQSLVSKLTRCGDWTDTRKEAVFEAVYDEVRNMDQVDWGFLSNVLYEIDKIRNGGELDRYGGIRFGPARERYEQREKQLELRSSSVGQGALWQVPQSTDKG
jgi:hypothetical protein